IRLIEMFAVVTVCEDRKAAVKFDPANAAEGRLTHDEAALAVEQQAVGAGVLAIDHLLAVFVAPPNMATAAGEEAELGMPRGSFAGALVGEKLRFCAGHEDFVSREGCAGACERQLQEHKARDRSIETYEHRICSVRCQRRVLKSIGAGFQFEISSQGQSGRSMFL